jgi:translation initiation factor IF-3
MATSDSTFDSGSTGEGTDVRVLGPSREDLGVMPLAAATDIARERGFYLLTLDEDSNGRPCVVRMGPDFGLLIYDRDRARKEPAAEARRLLRDVAAKERQERRAADPEPAKWNRKRADRDKR